MRLALPLGLALSLLAPLALAQEFPVGEGARANPYGHSPIRVHLDLSNLTRESARYADEIDAALAYWEAGGNGALAWNVTFERVTRAEEADVTFWLVEGPRVSHVCGRSSSALGCAAYRHGPPRTWIEMVTQDDAGNYLAYDLIRNVAKHEIGHALGLPHHPSREDIMYWSADQRAARGWGPSSTPELKIGLGIAFAVALALSVPWVYRRWRRMLLEEQIETLTATEPPARCRESADGAHDWERRIVTLHGAAYALDVCAACEAARKPLERATGRS